MPAMGLGPVDGADSLRSREGWPHWTARRPAAEDGGMGTGSPRFGGCPVHTVAWGAVVLVTGATLGGAIVTAATGFEAAFYVGAAPGAAALAVVGALVVTRRPQTRTGWLLLAAAFGLAVALTGRQAAWWVSVDLGGGLGTAQWLIAISVAGFFVLILSMLLLFLTFPDGRLPSSRWRPVVALLLLVTLVPLAIDLTYARTFIIDPADFLTGTEMVGNAGVSDEARGILPVFDVAGGIQLLLMLLSIVALMTRLRHSDEDTRQRIKWAVYTAGAWLVLVPISTLRRADSRFWQQVQDLFGGLAFVLLAVGFGIALFRHRLWDIDVVVHRSMVYGALWLGIAAAYAVVAVGLGVAAGARVPLELAILITVLATLVFQPARRWLERVADRWAFGRRESPVTAVHGFGEAIDTAVRPADVANHLADAAAAVGLAWVEVEIEGSAPARSGTQAGRPIEIVPVSHGATTFGELRCQPHAGRALGRDEHALLEALAAQAGLAISHARLASRIVRAEESERRRIERDLHDGAQQELVGLVARLELARCRVHGDAATWAMLTALQADARDILSSLRTLAQGIHPTVLSDGGVAAAVEDRCSRLPIPVTLVIDPDLRGRRFGDDAEGATYFFVAEALTNVLKHSRASRVKVHLRSHGRSIIAEVIDDGTGFVPGTTHEGGLAGLADRLQALGGTLEVRSAPGEGTHLTAAMPALPVQTAPS
jgi:signal transduction histidine kinase